jgi:hypothetical protein
MAKRNRTINEAINELMQNYESALKEAVEYASSKAVKDIYQESMNCLEAYYDAYEPTSYERTDYLWHAILPYAEQIKHTKDGLVSVVGVAYDPSRLDGIYNGSKQYSPVDGAWVLDNYLRGVHPATDGSPIPGAAYYYEISDLVSPTDTMNTYLNKYATTTFQNNILVSFAKQIARMK